jgi:hypothetical protein
LRGTKRQPSELSFALSQWRNTEKTMQKVIPPDKARQGRLGRPVLVVLVVALALTMGVWAAVEFFAG